MTIAEKHFGLWVWKPSIRAPEEPCWPELGATVSAPRASLGKRGDAGHRKNSDRGRKTLAPPVRLKATQLRNSVPEHSSPIIGAEGIVQSLCFILLSALWVAISGADGLCKCGTGEEASRAIPPLAPPTARSASWTHYCRWPYPPLVSRSKFCFMAFGCLEQGKPSDWSSGRVVAWPPYASCRTWQSRPLGTRQVVAWRLLTATLPLR